MTGFRVGSRLVGAAILANLCLDFPAYGQDTKRVSVDGSGLEANNTSGAASVSRDGRYVSFSSDASNLVLGDFNQHLDVFLKDMSSGGVTLISVDSLGNQGDGDSYSSVVACISGDGAVVCFDSDSTNLVSGDTNGSLDVFVRDTVSGVTSRVSADAAGNQGNGLSLGGVVSSDGLVVAFMSDATNLVTSDLNGVRDVFVHDLVTGVIERISVDSQGAEGDKASEWPSLSSDGRFVAFSSEATSLVTNDSNNKRDVFVRDRVLGTTTRVSVDNAGKQANGLSDRPSTSADGRFISFQSAATNLVSGDSNGSVDVFVMDLANATIVRCSVDSLGNEGNGACTSNCISLSGRLVAFSSNASNLVPGDTNGQSDCFLADLSTGEVDLASVDSAGRIGNSGSHAVSVSGNERVVVFDSFSSNLVVGDGNVVSDVFVHERCSSIANSTNYGTGLPGSLGVPSITANQPPSLGTTLDVTVGNSYGAPTVGIVLVGFQQATLHTKCGGDVLLIPAYLLPITFSFGGSVISGSISNDVEYCGLGIYLQVVEADPGAVLGVSFS